MASRLLIVRTMALTLTILSAHLGNAQTTIFDGRLASFKAQVARTDKEVSMQAVLTNKFPEYYPIQASPAAQGCLANVWEVGYRLNFIQFVTKSTLDPTRLVDMPGAPKAHIDPPIRGSADWQAYAAAYKKQAEILNFTLTDAQIAERLDAAFHGPDTLPFYWDEEGPADEYHIMHPSVSDDPERLNFVDMPGVAPKTSKFFVTSLVNSLQYESQKGTPYHVLGTFVWAVHNRNDGPFFPMPKDGLEYDGPGPIYANRNKDPLNSSTTALVSGYEIEMISSSVQLDELPLWIREELAAAGVGVPLGPTVIRGIDYTSILGASKPQPDRHDDFPFAAATKYEVTVAEQSLRVPFTLRLYPGLLQFSETNNTFELGGSLKGIYTKQVLGSMIIYCLRETTGKEPLSAVCVDIDGVLVAAIWKGTLSMFSVLGRRKGI